VYALDEPFCLPGSEVIVDQLPLGKVIWEQAPLGAGFAQVKNGINDFFEQMLAFTADVFVVKDFYNNFPLGIGQV